MTTAPERRTATLTELVAVEIDKVRGGRRMSQAQLARLMGKTPMWVSLRLRGQQPIDLNDMLLFARALGVEVHDLMPKREEIAAAVPERRDFKDLFLPLGRTADVERVAPQSPSPFGRPGRPEPSRPRSRDRMKGRRPPHQRPTVLPT